jgi:putative acetyltransferase
MQFVITAADLNDPSTQALLRIHLQGMQTHSPPGGVFALDIAGLRRADVTVWTAKDASRVVGIAALKQWADGSGEIKSMRTHPDHLRRGVARALLEHIIKEASRLNLQRLLLETGSGPNFEPALALYRARGFRNRSSFGDYTQSDFNQFLFLDLPQTEP